MWNKTTNAYDDSTFKTFSLIATGFLAFTSTVNPADVENPQIPVPPIQTELGTMPGVDQLPVCVDLPDPLIMNNGQRVTTTAQWQQRRPEMKRILSYYAVGLMPPAPGNVKGHDLKSTVLLNGRVMYRLVYLSFGPDEKLGFDIAIFTPADHSGPLPTVIFPSFDPTPGAMPLTIMPRRPEQGRGWDALRLPLGIPDTQEPHPDPNIPDPNKTAHTYQEIFRRGYALNNCDWAALLDFADQTFSKSKPLSDIKDGSATRMKELT